MPLHMKLNGPLDAIHVCQAASASMCVYEWPWWRTLPNVEEFESIEQNPFLHVVINLLIGPKARSSIDLPERRREKHSKNILVFFLSTSSHFFPFFSIQQAEMLCNYRSAFRASLEKRDLFPQGEERGEKRGERDSFKDILEILVFAWA